VYKRQDVRNGLDVSTALMPIRKPENCCAITGR
jgi:hypothetical protein